MEVPAAFCEPAFSFPRGTHGCRNLPVRPREVMGNGERINRYPASMTAPVGLSFYCSRNPGRLSCLFWISMHSGTVSDAAQAT